MEEITTIERALLNEETVKKYDEIYPLILREAGRTYFAEGKAYFNQGKNDFAMQSLETSLKCAPNESYTAEPVNLMTTGNVPDDCNLLVLMAPVKDFVESEVNAIF